MDARHIAWVMIVCCVVGSLAALLDHNWAAAVWALACGIWVNIARIQTPDRANW